MSLFTDYMWKLEGGIAVLCIPFEDPVFYTKEALEFAIKNVERCQKCYATQEAFEDHLNMFKEGLARFKHDNSNIS